MSREASSKRPTALSSSARCVRMAFWVLTLCTRTLASALALTLAASALKATEPVAAAEPAASEPGSTHETSAAANSRVSPSLPTGNSVRTRTYFSWRE